VWPSILTDLLALNQRRFQSGGREGGGRPWKKLDARTLAEKAKANQDSGILQRTLALRESVTRYRAPHQVVRMDPEQLLLGTELPYAGIVTKRRPIFRVPAEISESIARKYLRFVDEGR